MSKYVSRHIRKSQEERRAEIIDATLRIMSEHGVEGTTVARIAAEVGVTPGALYRHFENRGMLIAQANRSANERALEWVETSTETDVVRRLGELGETHREWAKANFETVVRPFFLELASSPIAEPSARLSLSDFKSFWTVAELAEEGKKQGLIRADVEAEDVAWALHMFAWAEDLAVMLGADPGAGEGPLRRNLRRMLASFCADAMKTEP